jgi:hypothetical protein
MIKLAYLDTSVFVGEFDGEFSEPTVIFFARTNNDKITLIVSEVLNAELKNAPERVYNLLNSISKDQIQTIDVTH